MRSLILFCLFILASCASSEDTRLTIVKEMANNGFSPKVYETNNFKIFSVEKLQDNSLPIRVYIEGDGKAFLAGGSMTSPDPTPANPLLVNLIMKDDYPNIIYLGRPCQYGLKDAKCNENYWTLGRFSKEVVDSFDQVLNRFKDKQLELVGYSGGAAIALFVAADNPNASNIRTIAGNIEHKEFTKLHDSAFLDMSLDSLPVINKVSQIPQIHFIGAEDKVVPFEVSQSYKQHQQDQHCTTYKVVENASHSEGWEEKWAELLKIIPSCQ